MLPDRVVAAVRRATRPVCAYVYAPDVVAARLAAVRAALPGVDVLYAVKANSHPAIVAAAAAAADGLDVASGGELDLALAAGARQIAFAGPAKTDDELRAAVAAGTLLHVESVHELRRLAVIAAGRPVRAALRVNRATAGPDGSHRMTGVPSPFGIPEDDLGEAVALGVPLLGFHLHAVSNNLDAATHAAFLADAVRWSAETAARLGVPLRYVNAGGGLGVDYTGDTRFDLGQLRVPALPDGVTLAVEPGRYVAADAGWYAAEVIDLKRTHGRWFAVLRGGTHHFRLPAAWGYSHPFTVVPVEEWPWPFPRPEVRDSDVDAVGELCTPRDVLTRAQRVDRLRAGDVLVFARTGAYGWDISHHDFLRHPHPEVVVVDPSASVGP